MKIVLIDDHQLITESLKSLLEQQEHIEKVNTYSDAATFLAEMSPQSLPDVLITDLVMEGINGLKLVEICRNLYKGSPLKIIILSSITDVQTIKQCIRAGANGFISKDTSLRELTNSIYEVFEGNQYIGEGLRDSLIKNVFVEEQIVYHLSPREKEVLHKVCQGLTIKEIAFDMHLSVHTVQYYHRNVLSKLKVKRTSDLIVYAMQHGLYIPEMDQKR